MIILEDYEIEIRCDDGCWIRSEYGIAGMTLEESKKFITVLRKSYPEHTYRLIESVTVKMVVDEA